MKASQTAPFGTDNTPVVETKLIGGKHVEINTTESTKKKNTFVNLSPSKGKLTATTSVDDNVNRIKKSNGQKSRQENRLGSSLSNQIFSPPTKRQQAILNEIKDQNQVKMVHQSLQKSNSINSYANDHNMLTSNGHNKLAQLGTLAGSQDRNLDLLLSQPTSQMKASQSLPLKLTSLQLSNGSGDNHKINLQDNIQNNQSNHVSNGSGGIVDKSSNTPSRKGSMNVLPPITVLNDQLGKKLHQYLKNFDHEKYKHIYNTLTMMDTATPGYVSKEEMVEVCRLYQVPVNHEDLHQLLQYFVDTTSNELIEYEKVLKFMNAAQEGNFFNTRLASMPTPPITSPVIIATDDSGCNDHDPTINKKFHFIDREDARLIQFIEKELSAIPSNQLDIVQLEKALNEAKEAYKGLSISNVKQICVNHGLLLSDVTFDMLVNRCQNDDKTVNCRAFISFLKRTQPFLSKGSSPFSKNISNNLVNHGTNNSVEDNRSNTDTMEKDRTQWQQDILIKLDRISKEQEMLKNRQESLEQQRELQSNSYQIEQRPIEEMSWTDRYMELAMALDYADTDSKGIISKTEALHLVNKYNVSHQLEFDDATVLAAINKSMLPDNDRKVLIGNLLEALNQK